MKTASKKRKVLLSELPQSDYAEILALQRHLVEERISGRLNRDIILLLEHDPVFTLGKRGGRENLTVSRNFLEKEGVSIYHVERGGNITWHGPGQIVGYPIVNLKTSGLRVVEYVTRLEEVMIRVAGEFGVTACRDDRNRGVWVGGKKLGSIGISIRRSVSFHGFAFNVNPDMRYFGWINPCGLTGVRMTSLEMEAIRKLDITSVRDAMKPHLESVFNSELIPTDLSEVMKSLAREKPTALPC